MTLDLQSRLETRAPGQPAEGASDTHLSDRPVSVLAATDGRPQSDYALLAARRLAPAEPLGVVTVIAPIADRVVVESSSAGQQVAAQRDRVQWQLRRVLGADVRASVDVCAGDPAAALAKFTSEHGAPLLVVGIGRPKVADRLRGDESALRVVRAARTPVLAIAPGCALPANRVLVAVDFSATSFEAARLAVRLAAPGAEVILVHVAARRGEIAWGSGACGYRGDAERALAEWRVRLSRDFAGRLTTLVVHGDPATELMALATEREADLVAVGAWGNGPDGRDDIGNVAMRLVRCANWSVVVAPRVESSCSSTPT